MTVPKPTIIVGHPSGPTDENYKEKYIREKAMREQADEIVLLQIRSADVLRAAYEPIMKRHQEAVIMLGHLAGTCREVEARAGRISAEDVVDACERIADMLLGRGEKA